MEIKTKKAGYKIKERDIGKTFFVTIKHPVFITKGFVNKKLREVWNKI